MRPVGCREQPGGAGLTPQQGPPEALETARELAGLKLEEVSLLTPTVGGMLLPILNVSKAEIDALLVSGTLERPGRFVPPHQ